uniref:Ribosomal protein L5 N-terminal domain-containing protein n=2 Tax=Physcomitrium patens TaxID=3218 RepID=A0A7I4FMA9_PHYPA
MIKVQKLVLNISIGKSGDCLIQGFKLLEQLSGQSLLFSKARYIIYSFGIKCNKKIACYIIVCGKKTMQLLENSLKHIDLGIKYNPSINIYKIDFYIVLEHPSYKVKRKYKAKSCIGIQYHIIKKDIMKWF